MKRKAILGVVLCVVAAVAACDASNVTGPGEQALGPQTPSASAARPSASISNGPRTVTGYLEGYDEYGDLCGGGAGISIISTGVGTVSHFGKSVMVSTSCVTTEFTVIGPVPFSLEAANGDEVGGFLTDFVFTSYGFDLYTEITWGTGRFEGASGELVFPTASTGTGIWSSGVRGSISY